MNDSEIIIYQNFDGTIKLDVRLEDETVWFTQAHMAQLFEVKPQNITMHLKNIYAEGELSEESTCKEFLQVQQEGTRQIKNLADVTAILSLTKTQIRNLIITFTKKKEVYL